MPSSLRWVIACCITAFGFWLFWGMYTIQHAADEVTWPYAAGTLATVLGPLVVALFILARAE